MSGIWEFYRLSILLSVAILGNKKSMRLFESQETHLVCLQCRYKNIISWCFLHNCERKNEKLTTRIQFCFNFKFIFFYACTFSISIRFSIFSLTFCCSYIGEYKTPAYVYYVEWQIRFKRNVNRKSLLQHFWFSAKFAIPIIPFDDHANVCFFYIMLCFLYLHSIKHIITLWKKLSTQYSRVWVKLIWTFLTCELSHVLGALRVVLV